MDDNTLLKIVDNVLQGCMNHAYRTGHRQGALESRLDRLEIELTDKTIRYNELLKEIEQSKEGLLNDTESENQ